MRLTRAEGVRGQMHLYLHDYAGHPFQADLSRELARRGWRVSHAFFEGDPGPKGALARLPGDPAGLSFRPLGIDRPYSKTNLLRRRRGDLAYGKVLADDIRALRPDLILTGNTPLEAQEALRLAARELKTPYVFWCQDIYSLAAERLLTRRLGAAGRAVGSYYRALERRQMREAGAVVLIAEAFRRVTESWGIGRDGATVIPNWASLDALPLRPRSNDWSREHGFWGRARILYTGTLAMKHDPAALNHLAARLDADIGVVAAGSGVEELATGSNLRCFRLQPFERFPDVLGTADVLVATIESDAGAFSVPSKILSYLCAGRPIVLAAPKENLAARILDETGAGTVVPPGHHEAFACAVQAYLHDDVAARMAGLAGRAYAEANFPVDHIADRFEQVFGRCVSRTRSAVA